jgi:hypothetical protein
MNKEKLIITCEIEDLPEDSNIMDFQIRIVENGWLTRIFKNWKKIRYERAIITKMEVEKKP